MRLHYWHPDRKRKLGAQRQMHKGKPLLVRKAAVLGNVRAVVYLLVTVLLASCQPSRVHESYASDYRIPRGSKLILHEPIAIPPHYAHVDIQAGRVVPVGRVQELYPFCELEVTEVKPVAQHLTPDTFIVHKIGHRIYDVRVPWIRLAGIGLDAALFGGDGPLQTFYVTDLHLRSNNQPNILKLSCQSNQRAFPGILYARHLSIVEIRGALGGLFTLLLPGQALPNKSAIRRLGVLTQRA